MKNVFIVIGILGVITFLIKCGDVNAQQHHHDVASHSSHTSLSAFEDGLDQLELNNGTKWKMDAHTRSSFARMAEFFLNIDHISLEGEGLKKAGANLQNGINELITGCTMSGDAHEQLHIFLLSGYVPAVSNLIEFGGVKEAQKVKHYLEKYIEYFE
ncbi:hypothetical protein MNBD_UNCLBAC01-1979 [hydrothermal vent metagenome]|uniref:Uncharacterized protein n=1 Tax=hydrothermal vent metagenome TaxID=652676 RepID=A0A3B1D1S8_9ZZZZ